MANNNTNLTAQWVTGFIDGEGCFHVSIAKSNQVKLGFEVQLQFSITQHIRDLLLMQQFPIFFNCGYILNDGPNKVQFRIRSISQIENNLLPFFETNPLLTVKSLDLADFIKVFNLMKSKKHLTLEGLEAIKAIQSNMNSRRIIE